MLSKWGRNPALVLSRFALSRYQHCRLFVANCQLVAEIMPGFRQVLDRSKAWHYASLYLKASDSLHLAFVWLPDNLVLG